MTTYTTEAAQQVADMTTWHVADLADASADNSEAEAFWGSIRDDLAEAIEDAEGERPSDDRLTEIVDNAPDVYNYTRMMEAIGTGAYLNTSEHNSTHDTTLLDLAGYVLYDVAEQAIDAMLTEVGL